MSAVIAVAGRYGVGKSVLVNQMVENGARLASFLENDQGICHQNQLEKIILREAGQGITVIEIPSFLAIGTWAQLNWSAIIVVDCPDKVQQAYLNDREVIDQHSRAEYTQVATDIFLNTIDLLHIDWVAKQLLRTYEII